MSTCWIPQGTLAAIQSHCISQNLLILMLPIQWCTKDWVISRNHWTAIQVTADSQTGLHHIRGCKIIPSSQSSLSRNKVRYSMTWGTTQWATFTPVEWHQIIKDRMIKTGISRLVTENPPLRRLLWFIISFRKPNLRKIQNNGTIRWRKSWTPKQLCLRTPKKT